jgi:molecular chaperone DnaK
VHKDVYGLGIDIGDVTVCAAICRLDHDTPTSEMLWLGADTPFASAAIELTEDGRARLDGAAPDPTPRSCRVTHVMDRVGTPAPFHLDGGGRTAAEVVTAVVRRVREVAESQEGGLPAATVLTVPPSWGAHRHRVLIEALEREAPAEAFSLVSAAVAVAHHHEAAGDIDDGATVAVYDLGASTLDTAVVGTTVDGWLDHLAVPPDPVRWGGRDIDDALLGHVLRWTAEEGTIRPDGRTLRDHAVAAKHALSTETATVLGQGSAFSLRITREELDELIAPGVEASVDALHAAIAAADLTCEDLDAVVLAGGATRVPLVAELVSAGIGRHLVIGPEPESVAALGAARLAADSLVEPGDDEPAALPSDDADDERRDAPPVPPARRPPRRGSRPASAPPGRGRLGPADAPGRGRVAARAGVVGAAFLTLTIMGPAMAAIFSSDIGPALTDSVSRADTPTDAPSETPSDPAPGAAGTGALFAGVEVEGTSGAAESSRPAGSSSTTSSARAVEQQALAASSSSAAGTSAPVAGSPTTSAPVAAPAPAAASAPAHAPAGGTTPVPGTTPLPDTTTAPPSPEPQPEPSPEPPPSPDPVPEPDPQPSPEPAPDTGGTDAGGIGDAPPSEPPATEPSEPSPAPEGAP